MMAWLKLISPTQWMVYIIALGLTFAGGTFWGVGLGTDRAKAAQLDDAVEAKNFAVDQRNAIIEASQKLAASNAALNEKITGWTNQYQRDSRALTERVINEITTNHAAYDCTIPDSGMRLRTEARNRIANGAATSGVNAALPATPATQR